MDNLLFGFTDFRHSVSPSGIADPIARVFWTRDAEASASSDASASCYGLSEDVRILAVVVAELKFVQVQRKVLLADVVVSAYHAALEQRPKVFDVVRALRRARTRPCRGGLLHAEGLA